MSKRTQLAGGIVHGGKGTGERPVTAQNCAATAGAAIGVLLTPAGELWMAKCRQEFRSRGRVLAEAAPLTSGLGEDEVVERLLDSEDLQPMVARVLDAAVRTNSTETLRLLGGVLGESVSDRPRKIDEDLMLVDGITGLEPGHLRVLKLFEGSADPSNPNLSWGVETITAASADDMSEVASQAAIGALLSRGLIQITAPFGASGLEITEFGRALLGALRRSAASLSPRRQADRADRLERCRRRAV